MRHFAITGIVTASWISLILSGSDIRATPPSRRMSAGTRSSAITAHAPAASAIFACSASTTSMITPPLSISASPPLTRIVPVSYIDATLARNERSAEQPTDRGIDAVGIAQLAVLVDRAPRTAGGRVAHRAQQEVLRGVLG